MDVGTEVVLTGDSVVSAIVERDVMPDIVRRLIAENWLVSVRLVSNNSVAVDGKTLAGPVYKIEGSRKTEARFRI